MDAFYPYPDEMLNALKQPWPEYLMEAAELGIFMVSACMFGVLLEYPGVAYASGAARPFAAARA